MSFYAISDIHIVDPSDPAFDRLLRLMELPRSGDCLFLGGDIFDLYLGDKAFFSQKYRTFFERLQAAGERGVQIIYSEGNHDLLLEGAMSSVPGLELVERSTELQQGGKRFFLAHGDLVDSSDRSYLLWRKFLRSWFMKGVIWMVPGFLVDQIGQWASRASQAAHGERHLDRLRKVFRDFAMLRFQEGFDFVVLGHCHDLDEWKQDLAGRSCHYVNIGFPKKHQKYLYWKPGQEWIERRPF